MSPVFSEVERENIHRVLVETGRELFAKQGLKKTSLEDLTRPAGIHKTSFYSFFESKEDLYLELLILEGPGVEERVWRAAESTDDTREAIARFLRAVISELETNPLVRRLITHPEELQMVARKVRPEHEEVKKASLLPLRRFVEQGQERGKIVDQNPEVVSGVLRGVTMLTLHKDDIGEDLYPDVLGLMIELVAAGLTAGEGTLGERTSASTSNTAMEREQRT